MALLRNLTGPVVRAATSFQCNHAWLLRGKELQQLRTPDLPAEDHAAINVSSMRVENMLRDVQSNCDNFLHVRLP